MELTYDWNSFRSIFVPAHVAPAKLSEKAKAHAPIYLVLDQGMILHATSEVEDVSHLVGQTLESVKSSLHAHAVVQYDQAQVDRWMSEASALPHYFEQTEFLKSKAKAEKWSGYRKHFLLEAIDGWWAKILPSAYGIFLRLESGEGAHSFQDFFLVVRGGRLVSFHKPDLSYMGPDRCKQASEVVKYLSRKHLLPVQGVLANQTEWDAWLFSPAPWKEVAASLRANRTRFVPFRWSIATLMATRAFFKV